MKILITGANGFLGQHLTFSLSDISHEVTAVSKGSCRIEGKSGFLYKSLDLTDKTAVEELVAELKPQVIIHNAAMSKPDACNDDKDECLRQNVDTTSFLLHAAKEYASYFIYVSTDFIFGENGPHAETATPEPLNFYGESKLKAEQLVKQSGLKYAIMRPVFIYGPAWQGMRPTFLHWVQNSLAAGKKIKVVNDQWRTPTYVYDICNGIRKMIELQAEGYFHLAGKDILTPYQMAVSVAQILGLDASLIESVTSESFPEPVKRSKRSGLKIEKAREILGYEPVSFEEGVRESFKLY
ncbi:SDR family oxidoreductase [Chitinophagaceae bacterium LWZ2-11]